jgi:hypothetical protein
MFKSNEIRFSVFKSVTEIETTARLFIRFAQHKDEIAAKCPHQPFRVDAV